MRADQEGIEATHPEIIRWVEWYTQTLQRQGKSLPDCNLIGEIICNWLLTADRFAAVCDSLGLPCPKCHGRGHTNLYLIGQAKPSTCDNCAGTGVVVPINQKMEAKRGTDEPPAPAAA